MKFTVNTQRMQKCDFPMKAHVQYGEIFGKIIEWEDVDKVNLTWSDEVNLQDEAGIDTNNGWGFAGWDSKKCIYTRYANDYSEHCMRILEEARNTSFDTYKNLEKARAVRREKIQMRKSFADEDSSSDY